MKLKKAIDREKSFRYSFIGKRLQAMWMVLVLVLTSIYVPMDKQSIHATSELTANSICLVKVGNNKIRYYKGTDAASSYYLINNVTDLEIFRQIVAGASASVLAEDEEGNSATVAVGDLTQNAVVVADTMTLPDDWTGIGTSGNPYTGTFHGNGHSIAVHGSKGVFGVTSNANIYDTQVTGTMTVGDTNVTDVESGYIGALVSHMRGGTIENCQSSVTMTVSASNTTINSNAVYILVGGLVGYGEVAGQVGTITQSTNAGAITVTGEVHSVGGIVGTMGDSSDITLAMGDGKNGYTALTNGSKITDCINTVAITVNHDTTPARVGGIVGLSQVPISEVGNEGAITENKSTSGADTTCVGGILGNGAGSLRNAYNIATVKGAKYVGGMVGRINNDYTINNAFNTGEISADNSFAGGILGGIVDETSVNVTICGVVNTGAVSITKMCAGGVVGKLPQGTIRYAYNQGEIKGQEYLGGITGGYHKLLNPIALENCVNKGEVKSSWSGNCSTGGLIGYFYGTKKNDVYLVTINYFYNYAKVYYENTNSTNSWYGKDSKYIGLVYGRDGNNNNSSADHVRGKTEIKASLSGDSAPSVSYTISNVLTDWYKAHLTASEKSTCLAFNDSGTNTGKFSSHAIGKTVTLSSSMGTGIPEGTGAYYTATTSNGVTIYRLYARGNAIVIDQTESKTRVQTSAGGNIYLNGVVTSGHEAEFTGIDGSTKKLYIYGGGQGEDLNVGTSITMTGGTVTAIYGGGQAADVGDVTIHMTGGTVSNRICGTGLNGQAGDIQISVANASVGNVLEKSTNGTIAAGASVPLITCSGTTTVSGNISAEMSEVTIAGTTSATGTVSAKKLTVTGTSNAMGNVSAPIFINNGTVTVNGTVSATTFTNSGTATITGNVTVTTFTNDGTAIVNGNVTANKCYATGTKTVVTGNVKGSGSNAELQINHFVQLGSGWSAGAVTANPKGVQLDTWKDTMVQVMGTLDASSSIVLLGNDTINNISGIPVVQIASNIAMGGMIDKFVLTSAAGGAVADHSTVIAKLVESQNQKKIITNNGNSLQATSALGATAFATVSPYHTVTLQITVDGVATNKNSVYLQKQNTSDAGNRKVLAPTYSQPGFYTYEAETSNTVYDIWVDGEKTGKTVTFASDTTVPLDYVTVTVKCKEKDSGTESPLDVGPVILANGTTSYTMDKTNETGTYTYTQLKSTASFHIQIAGETVGSLSFQMGTIKTVYDYKVRLKLRKTLAAETQESLEEQNVALYEGDTKVCDLQKLSDGIYVADIGYVSADQRYTLKSNGKVLVTNVEPGELYDIKYRRVKYFNNGGTGSEPSDERLYVKGESIPLPGQGDLKRDGYQFLGWSTNQAATEADAGCLVDGEVTKLYAVWKANSRYEAKWEIAGETYYGTFAEALQVMKTTSESVIVTLQQNAAVPAGQWTIAQQHSLYIAKKENGTGITCTIPAGVTVINEGYMEIGDACTLKVDGSLVNKNRLQIDGTLEIGNYVENQEDIYNDGSIHNDGTFMNAIGAYIENANTSSIVNQGQLINKTGGTITNPEVITGTGSYTDENKVVKELSAQERIATVAGGALGTNGTITKAELDAVFGAGNYSVNPEDPSTGTITVTLLSNLNVEEPIEITVSEAVSLVLNLNGCTIQSIGVDDAGNGKPAIQLHSTAESDTDENNLLEIMGQGVICGGAGTTGIGGNGIEIYDTARLIISEQVTVRGGQGGVAENAKQDGQAGGTGLVVNSTGVITIDGYIYGGDGASSIDGDGGNGGTGLYIDGSVNPNIVVSSDVDVNGKIIGGRGGNSYNGKAGDGGVGLDNHSAVAVDLVGYIVGGEGGTSVNGQNGADGLAKTANSKVKLLLRYTLEKIVASGPAVVAFEANASSQDTFVNIFAVDPQYQDSEMPLPKTIYFNVDGKKYTITSHEEETVSETDLENKKQEVVAAAAGQYEQKVWYNSKTGHIVVAENATQALSGMEIIASVSTSIEEARTQWDNWLELKLGPSLDMIDSCKNLSEEQKQNYKEELTSCVRQVKEKIGHETSLSKMETYALENQEKLVQIVEIAKEVDAKQLAESKANAIATITGAAVTARETLADLTDLTEAERASYEEQIQAWETAAKTEITGKDSISAVALTVTTEQTQLQNAIIAIAQAADLVNAKTKAKAKVEEEIEKAKAEISQLSALTEAEKQAYIDALEQIKTNAKEAISKNADKDFTEIQGQVTAGITTQKTEATQANTKAQALADAKAEAVAAITEATVTAREALADLTDLTEAERASYEKQIQEWEEAAKKAIAEADTTEKVAATLTEQEEKLQTDIVVAAQSTDLANAKAKAIAEVEEQAATAKKEISQLPTLTEAEKQAYIDAVDQIVADAIQAITEKTDKDFTAIKAGVSENVEKQKTAAKDAEQEKAASNNQAQETEAPSTPQGTEAPSASQEPERSVAPSGTEEPSATDAVTDSGQSSDTTDNQNDTEGEDTDSTALTGTYDVQTVTKWITSCNTDAKDPENSRFIKLQPRAKGGNKKIKISWKKQSGAKGYIIYGAACGKKMEELARVKASKKSWTHKKLKKATYYKYIVVAYKIVNGQERVTEISVSVHESTKGGKNANPKKVQSKKKVTLVVGKKKTWKAKVIKSGKKLKVHIAKLRYELDKEKIVTVNKKGKIKALKKGSCTMYVYAQNGVFAKVKIKVKAKNKKK